MNTLFQVLTLSWSLQGGYLPNINTGVDFDVLNSGPVYFAEYGFEVAYPIFTNCKADPNGLYLGTSLRNEFRKGDVGLFFNPIQDTYTFSGGLRWNEFTLGYDHVCTHSIETLIFGQVSSQRFFGATDKLFVKINGKI